MTNADGIAQHRGAEAPPGQMIDWKKTLLQQEIRNGAPIAH
jgi:hypothetical protein